MAYGQKQRGKHRARFPDPLGNVQSRTFARSSPTRSAGSGSIRPTPTYRRDLARVSMPEEIRAAARLEDGDLFDAEITDEGILLRPRKVIDATQARFWTPEWQAGEREADADRTAGRVESFGSDQDFSAALRSIAKPGAKRAPKR